MTTVKNGSRGADVTTLQEALNKAGRYGLAVDGIFGAKTEAAVRDFQKRMALAIDGIVGPKTWSALGYSGEAASFGQSGNSKRIDPEVVFMPLPVGVTKCSKRTPQYLAIHFTAGSTSAAGTARKNYDVFVARAKTNKPGSADFAVDDREMVQLNPDIENYYCWAVGDKLNAYSKGASLYGKAKNSNTVSIEICSTCSPATSANVLYPNHGAWSLTDAAVENAARLAKIIMKRFNIPIERVVRHYDITGKMCPGVPGWNDDPIYDPKTGKATSARNTSEKWTAFKKKLSS